MLHNPMISAISRRVSLQIWSKQAVRLFHPEFTSNLPKEKEEDNKTKLYPPAGLESKYDIFKDEDSPEIFDVEEEKRKYRHQQIIEVPETKYQGLNLDRKLF